MPPNSWMQLEKYDAVVYYEFPGFSSFDAG